MKKGLFNGFKMLLAVVLAIVTAAMFVACDRGNTGGGLDEEDAVAPVISGFAVQADDGATYGKVGEAHKLSYTVTGTCTSESVSVKKDGAAASADSYEYTTQTKKIVFKEAGEYTVTLTAMNGTKGSSANANVSVTAFDAPSITAVLAQTVYVDTEVDFAPTATYAEGDAAGTHSLSVLFCATEDGEYVAATNSQYTYVNNKFTALALGYYKITLTVTSLKGATAQQDYTVHSIGIGTMNLNHDYGNTRILVEKDALTTLNYTAEGGIAEDFDITYDYDETKLTVVAGDGSSIKVTASENGDYNIKVIYTHKGDEDAVSDLTFSITVKDDINAPVFGADPFGGTWTELIPNVGMMLYFDATDDKAETLGYGTHVTYAVTNGGSLNSNQASIAYAGDNQNYPYLVSTRTGTVEVQITVTDDHENSATATKTFNVANATSYSTYGDSVYDGALGKLRFDDNSTAGLYKNVITKNGVIANRENANLDGTIGMINVNRDAQFELSFDLTIVANNPSSSGYNSLFITLWTGPTSGDSWAGNMGMNWTTANNAIGGADWTNEQGSVNNNVVTKTAGSCAVGTTVRITVKHTIQDNLVYWEITLTYNNATTTILSFNTAKLDSEAGKSGSLVNNIVLNHFDMGTYLISDIAYKTL